MKPPWKLLQLIFFLSAAAVLSVSSSRIVAYYVVLIDCGSPSDTILQDNITKWRSDQEFINTGKTAQLAPNNNFSAMNTLRYFPDGSKSCYKLPLSCVGCKFLFRAGFFYGNYDGLSKPPSFQLEIDGNLWANVTAPESQEEPVYHELIYMTKKQETSVCLVRDIGDEVPFISSLEAKYLFSDMYGFMENDTALYLHSRIDYGANKTFGELINDHYSECCNRIWESKEMTEYLNITIDFIVNSYILEENYPPWLVMASAIQAKNVTDSIYLSVNFTLQATVRAYFVLYFMDPIFTYPDNRTSNLEIYIDSKNLGGVTVPDWGRYKDAHNVVTLYPVLVSGSANVTISPAAGSTMGPLLNAMEVYYAIDASQGSGGRLHGLTIPLWVISLHLLSILVVIPAH